MKSITVFTPSYNRAHLLPKLYESLKSQTSRDFIWMIIDDGSSDATEALVNAWMQNTDFEIQYHYKENGGMHTAHNLAYSLIETELNVCIDSDDQMPFDAIEKIIKIWNAQADSNSVGIIGLDADLSGSVIGTFFPPESNGKALRILTHKYGLKGDKKFVLKTSTVKKYPSYPEYESEKLVPLGSLYHMIAWDNQFIYSNEIFCLVDYQIGGSSATIFKQYFVSPRGFVYERNIRKKYSESFRDDLINSTHLGVSAIILKDYSLLFKGPKFIYNVVLFPVAIVFYFYLKQKVKN